MRSGWIRRSLAGSMLLLVAAAAPATAQLRNLTATGYTGVAVPFGQFAEYASVGASAGLQLEYPINEPLAVMLNAEVDMPQSEVPGIPDFRLWRYQAGVAANLLGNPSESWGLRGLLGAGATSFRTGGFFPNQQNVEERLSKTYFTGTGGLELVFGGRSPLQGHLGARLHWTPVKESDWARLRTAALGAAPDPVENAIAVPITLGLRISV